MPKVNPDTLVCSKCGTPVPNPGYRLSLKQAAGRLCSVCFAANRKKSGRTILERNSAIQFSEEMEQVFLGSVLGDGHLEPPPRGSINWGLGIKHAISQQTYALRKAELLGPLLSKISYPWDRGFHSEGPPDQPKVRVRTIRHPRITAWAQRIVKNGVKTVPPELLQSLGPQALAIWYLDDGSLLTRVGKRGALSHTIRISSFSFTVEENTALRETLNERFGVLSTVWKCGKYQGIKISGNQAVRFLEVTKPYMKGMGLDYKTGLVGSASE